MLNSYRRNTTVDKRLMHEWDLTDSTALKEASPVFDILEQGGFNERVQFQLNLSEEQAEGVAVKLTVECSDEPDGTFVTAQELTSEPRADGEDLTYERVSCHCKRYVKVTPSVSIASGAASGTAASGTVQFAIAS